MRSNAPFRSSLYFSGIRLYSAVAALKWCSVSVFGCGMLDTSQRTSAVLQAYRLLAEEMYTKGWDYPLHLGVTEVRSRAAARISDAKASSDVHPAR
jgi:4-hydroxy-3-methylbut-2-en-1-yl diphosphate synthase IspG/GcpE